MYGVKLHKSVADWKEDYLELFSDMYKDAYGHRPRGYSAIGWLFDESTTMEEVMEEDHRVYARVLEEIAEADKRKLLWKVKVWIHNAMLLEAKCEDSGIVYPNPEWCESCERHKDDSYGGYSEWAGVVGPELYYFDKPAKVAKMSYAFEA